MRSSCASEHDDDVLDSGRGCCRNCTAGTCTGLLGRVGFRVILGGALVNETGLAGFGSIGTALTGCGALALLWRVV
jgi:hypothetical protein